ncbi:MAG: hypothetical protein IJB50_02510 [Clostridia bacterium]|nr:hypothetical protein [Clostridia bacterium]
MKIAIAGYGNLGRGAELSIAQNEDLELFGVFTRRAPETVKTETGAKVYSLDDILKYKDEIEQAYQNSKEYKESLIDQLKGK